MPEGEGKKAEILDLSEVAFQFGRKVLFCLEPDEVRKKKIAEGKEGELWCFDPATGRISRGDGKYCDARYVDRGGWGQVALYEEPDVPQPADGGPRIVGHVIVEKNQHGLVRVRRAKSLNGEVLELQPSSISKGELAKKGLIPLDFIESNPQRIKGVIAVYLVDTGFPDSEGMTPDDFRGESTDCRSLAALAKAGL